MKRTKVEFFASGTNTRTLAATVVTPYVTRQYMITQTNIDGVTGNVKYYLLNVDGVKITMNATEFNAVKTLINKFAKLCK